MRVTITDVDQRFSLATQSFSNFLVLELPSGAKFQVSVDDETVTAVIAESQGQPSEPRSTPRPPPPRVAGVAAPVQYQNEESYQDTQFSHEEMDANPFEESDYEDLREPQYTPVGEPPEKLIAHHVESGLVEWELLPDTQLPPTIKQILKMSGVKPQLTIEELDQLKLEISTKLASRPKPGVVDWDQGPRRKMSSVPRRSVQMDVAGNPIPPGGIIEMQPEADPGEVRDEEEDGIQQA